MSIANKLYDRSHGFVGDVNATNPDDLPALYITGSLPDAPTGEAYEGRLQIHNAVGSCTVKLLSGTLPPGNTISVDNQHSQVVIKWPSFKAGTADIPNNNFSKGDDGSWELGPGWSIMSGVTPPDPNDPGDTHQAQFDNLTGESAILSNFLAPVADAKLLGAPINASVDVQQGASSANKAGAAVRVLFYDEVGFQVGGADGEVVKSGSDSNWATSHLSTPIPHDAVYARIGASAYRKSQNRTLWVDNLKWDLVQASQGIVTVGTVNLSIRVTDSVGRVADWSGTILVVQSMITGHINFNSDLTTDLTGRVWGVTPANITDPYGGQPVTVPFVSAINALEGQSAVVTPDVSFHTYRPNYNANVYTEVTDDVRTAMPDFCIEFFARTNTNLLYENTNSCLMALAVDDKTAPSTTSTQVVWEIVVKITGQNNLPISPLLARGVVSVPPAPTLLFPQGVWTHVALTKRGDTAQIWMGGDLIVEWTNANAMFTTGFNYPKTFLILGSEGYTSGFRYFAWPGDIDDVRITKGWCRYQNSFTPPDPLY